jgi:hypothetical protein
MISEAVEWLKLAGSIGGLAASGFLVYDRVYRLRPIVYLQPHENHVHLKIKNTADEALVIDEIDIFPKVLAIVVKEHGEDFLSRVDASVDAMYGDEPEGGTFSVLRPLEERSFRLVVLKDCDDLKEHERIRIRCNWRTTRRPWPFTRSVSVTTTPKDFRSYLIASRPMPTSPKKLGVIR